MSNIRFSQLPTTQSLKDTDIVAVSAPDTSTPPVYTSVQATIAQVASKTVEDTTFTTSLKTTNKTVAGSINETLSNFANEYDTTASYSIGDCVLYAGGIYQCNTDISGGEAWTPAHWTQVKAVDVGSGGSSGDHITLTQAQYDALVQAGTVDPNAYYFIEDGSPSAYTVKQLFFDDAYSSTSQTGTTINLSESMANFDMIAVRGGYIPNSALKDTGTQYIMVSEINRLITEYPDQTWVCSFYYHAQYGVSAVLKFNSLTEIYVHDVGLMGYQGTVGRVVEVTGIKFDSKGGETHQYSTEEQVVGKWIDGSLVYEKVVTLTNNTANVSSLNIKILVACDAIGCDVTPYSSSSARWLVSNTSGIQNRCFYLNSSGDLHYEGSFNIFYAIIRYTKSSS